MNTTAKKFNIAVGVLAIICILLTALFIAVTIIAINVYGKNGEDDAGKVITLVLISAIILWPTLIITALLNLVAMITGIIMLVSVKDGEISHKAFSVVAAVMEIISATLLLLINILLEMTAPLLFVNNIPALLMLGIGIVTCVFSVKYARKKISN